MSASQNLADCRLMSDPPFAIKQLRRSTVTRLRPRDRQKTATTVCNEDQALIERAVAGDSVAQSRLFEAHTPRLYRVAFSVLHNKQDAEDAVQDGWCRAYSKLQTFEGRSSLSTWLTRIIINSALMIRRRNKHQFLTSLDEISDDTRGVQHYLVDGRCTPEDACREKEINELLIWQIKQLPPSTRTAFVLRDVGELSTSESMERLGVKTSALKSRVLRARRRIAQNMRRLLHADRQRRRSFTTADRRVANPSSITTSSAEEASHDRV